MAHVSHRLTNAFEGALAGGGDPATSPLYVFGPFLKLIVVAGVASVTFGASIWLVILTITMVSAMYWMVMHWVTDGSGGSGLNEEEFGSWAVKINAGITFVEYTLTFLVSMAALVTFIADRAPVLNQVVFGIQIRTVVAILLSVLTGWLVNRGPKAAARAFGPATAGVLVLLWAMIIATVLRFGFHLPVLSLEAFTPEYANFTFGGYARILAVMTGIEIFANLVAAYDGTPREKSNKAFGSLLIIMGTTSLTMLVVGPAILHLSDPTDAHVSVFTQTMDQLLPAPLPWLGTLVGIAVLLSASAASAQGLQNLALGLKYRHYVPAFMGQRNKFDVADKPVWLEVGVVSFCFLLFGTSEETYLAIYAAGVFILLSMTGWAAAKRLLRELRGKFAARQLAALVSTIIAATLTSAATVVIFAERFLEGAWTYLLFIPALYAVFSYFRQRLGAPTPLEERLGRLIVEHKYLEPYQPLPQQKTAIAFENVLVPLDGSTLSEQAVSFVQPFCHAYNAHLTLISIHQAHQPRRLLPALQPPQSIKGDTEEREQYLSQIAARLHAGGTSVGYIVGIGEIADEINTLAVDIGADLIVMSTHGRTGVERWLIGSVASKILQMTHTPMLLIRPTGEWRSRWSEYKRLLVTLDGSPVAEQVLPYVKLIAQQFGSRVILLSVPDEAESDAYNVRIQHYLESTIAELQADGLNAQAIVTGAEPANTIISVSESESADLIMMATHGRGGLDRLIVGSVADRVVRHTQCPVFLVPAQIR